LDRVYQEEQCPRKLQEDFKEGIDYSSGNKDVTQDEFWSSILRTKKGNGGHNENLYFLTIDCFKSFCMMAGTDRGKEVRKYFIQIEKAWNNPEAVKARARQAGYTPYVPKPITASMLRECRLSFSAGLLTRSAAYSILGLDPLSDTDSPPPSGKPYPNTVKEAQDRKEKLRGLVEEFVKTELAKISPIATRDCYAVFNQYAELTGKDTVRWNEFGILMGSLGIKSKQVHVSGPHGGIVERVYLWNSDNSEAAI
jgi:phage anti-repressor protein